MTFGRSLAFAFIAIVSLSICSVSASELLGTTTRQRNCRVGICFAIDGSASISEIGFARQMSLAQQIMGNIPTSLSARFAAVQYGISNQAISELTADRSFIERQLRDAEQLLSERTFLTGGLNFCISELFDVETDAPICRRSVIILMGNGNDDVGADPAERARFFDGLVSGGDVLTVRFGGSADISLLKTISGGGKFFDALRNSIPSLATDIVERLGV